MPLRDLLRKKDRIEKDAALVPAEMSTVNNQVAPAITLLRSSTAGESLIYPPSFDEKDTIETKENEPTQKRSKLHFRNFSKSSKAASDVSDQDSISSEKGSRKSSHRLSRSLEKLHIRHSQNTSSTHIPENLPAIEPSAAEDTWETRATLLAQSVDLSAATLRPESSQSANQPRSRSHSPSPSTASLHGDVTIQEAIRLHEANELQRSTAMFKQLADPDGEANALAQVLYGLALRHGWGVEVDSKIAFRYLELAARSAAGIESEALKSGMTKGGPLKGELVLAVFELGNCFRYGWGCEIDPIAARGYYETAANLGDTDAMQEVAWSYLEGFGGKKDKGKAARYLRMAEEKGIKMVGQSWIWKEKYNEPGTTVGKK